MATPTRFEGDIYVNGNLQAKTLSIPSGGIVDANVAANAAIATTKLRHRFRGTYAQPNTTATTETKVIVPRIFGATATVISFYAGLIGVNTGGATLTVDLRKNGTTILTGAVSLTAATARTGVAGVISSANLIAGDELEVVVTATVGGGTLGTGVYAQVDVDEDAA